MPDVNNMNPIPDAVRGSPIIPPHNKKRYSARGCRVAHFWNINQYYSEINLIFKKRNKNLYVVPGMIFRKKKQKI